MKVIFLDIDGVLNSGDNMRALHRLAVTHGIKNVDRDIHGQLFDERCVSFLDCLIRETSAKIVVSSTWRRAGLPAMQTMWRERGLPGDVIDVTPKWADAEMVERYYQPGADRGYEIQEWLDTHSDIESYVILDDDSDMLSHQSFVKCDGKYGITYDVFIKALEILNKIN